MLLQAFCDFKMHFRVISMVDKHLHSPIQPYITFIYLIKNVPENISKDILTNQYFYLPSELLVVYDF